MGGHQIPGLTFRTRPLPTRPHAEQVDRNAAAEESQRQIPRSPYVLEDPNFRLDPDLFENAAKYVDNFQSNAASVEDPDRYVEFDWGNWNGEVEAAPLIAANEIKRGVEGLVEGIDDMWMDSKVPEMKRQVQGLADCVDDLTIEPLTVPSEPSPEPARAPSESLPDDWLTAWANNAHDQDARDEIFRNVRAELGSDVDVLNSSHSDLSDVAVAPDSSEDSKSDDSSIQEIHWTEFPPPAGTQPSNLSCEEILRASEPFDKIKIDIALMDELQSRPMPAPDSPSSPMELDFGHDMPQNVTQGEAWMSTAAPHPAGSPSKGPQRLSPGTRNSLIRRLGKRSNRSADIETHEGPQEKARRLAVEQGQRLESPTRASLVQRLKFAPNRRLSIDSIQRMAQPDPVLDSWQRFPGGSNPFPIEAPAHNAPSTSSHQPPAIIDLTQDTSPQQHGESNAFQSNDHWTNFQAGCSLPREFPPGAFDGSTDMPQVPDRQVTSLTASPRVPADSNTAPDPRPRPPNLLRPHVVWHPYAPRRHSGRPNLRPRAQVWFPDAPRQPVAPQQAYAPQQPASQQPVSPRQQRPRRTDSRLHSQVWHPYATRQRERNLATILAQEHEEPSAESPSATVADSPSIEEPLCGFCLAYNAVQRSAERCAGPWAWIGLKQLPPCNDCIAEILQAEQHTGVSPFPVPRCTNYACSEHQIKLPSSYRTCGPDWLCPRCFSDVPSEQPEPEFTPNHLQHGIEPYKLIIDLLPRQEVGNDDPQIPSNEELDAMLVDVIGSDSAPSCPTPVSQSMLSPIGDYELFQCTSPPVFANSPQSYLSSPSPGPASPIDTRALTSGSSASTPNSDHSDVADIHAMIAMQLFSQMGYDPEDSDMDSEIDNESDIGNDGVSDNASVSDADGEYEADDEAAFDAGGDVNEGANDHMDLSTSTTDTSTTDTSTDTGSASSALGSGPNAFSANMVANVAQAAGVAHAAIQAVRALVARRSAPGG